MIVNSKQIAQQSTSINTSQPLVTPVTDIIVGNGLSSTKHHDGTVNLELLTSSITRIESKPIFMVGLPSSTTDDVLRDTLIRMEAKMTDYHVLMLKNKTDIYTAKMFKDTGTDTLSFDEIKRYIDQKTK